MRCLHGFFHEAKVAVQVEVVVDEDTPEAAIPSVVWALEHAEFVRGDARSPAEHMHHC